MGIGGLGIPGVTPGCEYTKGVTREWVYQGGGYTRQWGLGIPGACGYTGGGYVYHFPPTWVLGHSPILGTDT